MSAGLNNVIGKLSVRVRCQALPEGVRMKKRNDLERDILNAHRAKWVWVPAHRCMIGQVWVLCSGGRREGAGSCCTNSVPG